MYLRAITLTIGELLTEMKRKELGAFYTPPEYALLVAETLSNYAPMRKVLDPASGSGNLLDAATQVSVSAHCVGFEIDELAVEDSRYSIETRDFLEAGAVQPFDTIIANPPYKSSLKHNLSELRSKFASFRGNSDIFLPFMEKCFNLLTDDGAMAFIVPQSFLTSKSGGYMRNMLKDHVREIWVSSEKVFDSNVYTTTMFFTKAVRTSPVIVQVDGERFEVTPLENLDSWGPLITPQPQASGTATLSDIARIEVPYIQQFYEYKPHIRERKDARSPVSVLTSGGISSGGPVTIGGRTFDDPVIDLARLSDKKTFNKVRRFRDGATRFYLASQTKRLMVVEAVNTVPITPVICVEPLKGMEDHVREVLNSDAANEWLAAERWGSALSPGAFRVDSGSLNRLPLSYETDL